MELKAIISKILETQHKTIAEQLTPLEYLFEEFEVPKKDVPEISIGYGFYDENNSKYNLKIVLEKEFD